jgi:hypothetical protein
VGAIRCFAMVDREIRNSVRKSDSDFDFVVTHRERLRSLEFVVLDRKPVAKDTEA